MASDRTARRPSDRFHPFLIAVPLLVALLGAAPLAHAGDVTFSPPQMLPGDATLGLASGHQEEIAIAAGGGGFLAVWSDCRASLDDSNAPAGSGYDIYGAVLDANGNVVDGIVLDEGPGNQYKPAVAWNGTAWLVSWMEPTPAGSPTYERIRGVRVAADGTVLDSEPFQIHKENFGCYCSFTGVRLAGGGADGWVALFYANAAGLRAVRVQSDGTVVNPEGLLVNGSISGVSYDIVFAQDEYMIVFGNGTQSFARRYSPTLQFLGQNSLPFAREVATDGTNFLVTGQWDYSWPPKIEAILLAHNGSVLVPRFTVLQGTSQWSPSGEGTGFDGTNYWVTWGGNGAARISATGQMLDPVGGFYLQIPTEDVSWPAYDTSPLGGLQYLWHDGMGGAEYPRDAYTARITPDAQVLGTTPVSVNAPAQVDPHLAKGNGVNMVVFRSRHSGTARILAQRLDDAGTPLDAEPIEVASGPVQWLAAPSIDPPQVAWNGSVFMVAWGDKLNVQGRRINPDGTFVDATPITVLSGTEPAVGALGNDFLFSGSLTGTLLSPSALRVARVDGTTGAVLDDPPIWLSGAGVYGENPHIVELGGKWLVVWESVYKDPWSTWVSRTTAYAFVEADGTTTGEKGAGLGERPGVGVSGDRALLIGIDDTVSGGYTDLEARILMADGGFLGEVFLLSTAPEDQLEPTATWDGTQFIAAWEDKRNAVIYFDERTDIYGTRVTAEGGVLDPGGIPLAASGLTERQPAFLTVGGNTLLATSTLRSDVPACESYRIDIHSTAGVVVQPNMGFGGPGVSLLTVAGQALATGGTADLTLNGAPANAPAWLVASGSFNPQPFKGGTLVPVPMQLAVPLTTDGSGQVTVADIAGGGGPFDIYIQFVISDPGQPQGYQLSNAVQLQFLP